MLEALQVLRAEAERDVAAAKDLRELQELRVKYLGKKGGITAILGRMGALSPEERPKLGAAANDARSAIEAMLEERERAARAAEAAARLGAEAIDVTIPGAFVPIGRQHPTMGVLDEIKGIFVRMGFTVAEGPEVEYDYYNFEALNIPKDHPARDTQDTFYISDSILLRTQTSPMQIRVMEKEKPPIRVICPGRVFRSDYFDRSHSPVFHQVEGLVVDRGITMGDLKGTLEQVARELYGEGAVCRFRPHHFPFTEPSAEMDVQCTACHGKGCPTCKGEGFLEVLGAGMVHPDVLSRCGIDPEVYSGFAFGLGLDRIAMLRYGIDDMRLMFENDLRFLRQF